MSEFILRLLQSAASAAVCFFVGVALASYWQWRRIRKLRSRLQALEGDRGGREMALVLSIGDNVAAAARAYLDSNGCEKVALVEVHQPGAFDDNEKMWLSYMDKVKAEVRRIREQGASRVYLFLRVPVTMAVFVGAMLDNGPEVVVHHYFNGTYRPVGRLTHETVKL